jgi:hypothetical protein
MAPLTVLSVFVRGPFAYTPEYVYNLAGMVRRHLHRPHRFLCFTDRPKLLPGIETIDVPSLEGQVPANGVGYWNKLQCFNPKHRLTGRLLYLDLDSLVVDDLAPIVDFPAAFAVTTDALCEERAHLDTDRYGRRLVRRFNSSVMVWDAGAPQTPELWTTWKPTESSRLSTDQDWIGEQATAAAGMPLAWFPRISQIKYATVPAEAKVILCKKPKNAEAVKLYPWINPVWRVA